MSRLMSEAKCAGVPRGGNPVRGELVYMSSLPRLGNSAFRALHEGRGSPLGPIGLPEDDF